MAVAGGGQPSVQVCIRNGQLKEGLFTNVPDELVCDDMAVAAEFLRKNPDSLIRISPGADGGNVPRLREYLIGTGHVT